MDLKIILLLLADLLLLSSSLVYGVKFLRKKNYLLGLEWLVVTVSTTHLLIYLLAEAQWAYDISFFLDAFSRGFGIPVIAVAGLMVLTHGYRPSGRTDVLFFIGAFAGTVVLVSADVVAKPLPYFYLLMWTLFSLYLAYFAWRLQRAGETGHAIGIAIALLSGQAIASIYDFYRIPGDEDQIVFLILALTVWAYSLAEMYYAYGALERAEARA